MVPDNHPLPCQDNILNNCARGKIWSSIDVMNSFFQMLMHPDDIHLTAVSTPFGLYEWLVMPIGLWNSLAIHQWQVTKALQSLIGNIYLDDIIIWSDTVEDHIHDIWAVFAALKVAKLYINEKKTNLFQTKLKFLGHKISTCGIEANEKKADTILAWPVLKTATQTWAFIGLVWYLSAFLPGLVMHTGALADLITKDADHKFPKWTNMHQHSFNGIKKLVVSCDCLTTIDLPLMPDYKIYVTTNASDLGSGAVLSFGKTWETARPVAFKSMTFKGAQLNYPVHEKEMLAIIRALMKWRVNLLGVPFLVYTDHKTLENFHIQHDLLWCQAHWMEFMSQYNAKIVYVKGEDNTVANALSWLPTYVQAEAEAKHAYSHCPTDEEDDMVASILAPAYSPYTAASAISQACPQTKQRLNSVCATLSISADKHLLQKICIGYTNDKWIQNTLLKAKDGMPGIQLTNGLWYIGNRLIIPHVGDIRETLFCLTHNILGHFGFDKTYGSLHDSFYWPNMRKELESTYIPGCIKC